MPHQWRARLSRRRSGASASPVKIAVAVIFFLAMIVWPLLTLPAGDFSLGYFRFYVVLGGMFLVLATVIGVLLPLWEAKDLVLKVRPSPSYDIWAHAVATAPLTPACACSSSLARPSRN